MQTRILVVEDEPAIAELIAINLRHSGFEPVLTADAVSAQAEIDRELPALVLLDWMLPDVSGLELARRWRIHPRTHTLPIIMLTARGDESDRVAGLDAGADDYIVKPFSPKEMLARIRALLRRKAPESLAEKVCIGALELDPAMHQVCCLGKEIRLAPTEFRLLHYLMHHPNRIYSRGQLLDKVWGDHVFVEERTVDVQIKRLREALSEVNCAHLIETVRGTGYRMVAPDSKIPAVPEASAGTSP